MKSTQNTRYSSGYSFIFSVILMVLSSCGETGNSFDCKKDSDCKNGAYCYNDLCMALACQNNSHCVGGRKCWESKCIVSICEKNNGGCHANATCEENSEERMCSCNQGFNGNGIECLPENNSENISLIGPTCHINEEGKECDDGKACTSNDVCKEGVCGGTVNCIQEQNSCLDFEGHCGTDGACVFDKKPLGTICEDDGFTCRKDYCDGNGQCIHPDSCDAGLVCCSCTGGGGTCQEGTLERCSARCRGLR